MVKYCNAILLNNPEWYPKKAGFNGVNHEGSYNGFCINDVLWDGKRYGVQGMDDKILWPFRMIFEVCDKGIIRDVITGEVYRSLNISKISNENIDSMCMPFPELLFVPVGDIDVKDVANRLFSLTDDDIARYIKNVSLVCEYVKNKYEEEFRGHVMDNDEAEDYVQNFSKRIKKNPN